MATIYQQAIKIMELEERMIINPNSFTDEELKDKPENRLFTRALKKNTRDLRKMKNDIDATLKIWEVDSLEHLTTRIGKLIEEKHELLANQKPSDLPSNWKTELARLPNLEKEVSNKQSQIT